MVKNQNQPRKRARQVTIPAGKEYLLLTPGEKVYVIEADGRWPDDLDNMMRRREETAYEKGINDGKAIAEGQARNVRQLTPEEFLQHFLPTLHSYHAKDQNQIAAVILDELTKARAKRLHDLEVQLANTRELIALCEDSQKGLQLVRDGGFEKLNFR
jgi:hypothetical protein